MKIYGQFPDPNDPTRMLGRDIELGGGPFCDEFFMSRSKVVAQSAVPVAYAIGRQPYGLNITNSRNAIEPSRATFNGRRRKS